MRVLERTLAILALLTLTVQTTRHVYVFWFEPRGSVLDRFDQPVRSQVAAANSLEELVQAYENAQREAEQLRASEPSKENRVEYGVPEQEPFKSAYLLREAIRDWESKAKDIRALRFYWAVGLALVLAGALLWRGVNRWLGLTVVLTGFSEMIYWTSPILWGPTGEGGRLLANKLALSAVTVAVLLAVIWLGRVFADDARVRGFSPAPGP